MTYQDRKDIDDLINKLKNVNGLSITEIEEWWNTILCKGINIPNMDTYPNSRLTSSIYSESNRNYYLFGLLENAHNQLEECDTNNTYSWFIGIKTPIMNGVKDNVNSSFVVMYNDTTGDIINSSTLDNSKWHTVFEATTSEISVIYDGELTSLADLIADIDLTNYVQKSSTSGLLKNDGTVDTTDYVSQTELDDAISDITSDTGSKYLLKAEANTTYLKQTDASNNYLSKSDASSTYLNKTDASNTYLTKSNANSTYLNKTDANSTYLNKTDATNTYLKQSDASNTYLTKTNANSTYLSKTDASNTYLTKTDASNTYAPKIHRHNATDVDYLDDVWFNDEIVEVRDGHYYDEDGNDITDGVIVQLDDIIGSLQHYRWDKANTIHAHYTDDIRISGTNYPLTGVVTRASETQFAHGRVTHFTCSVHYIVDMQQGSFNTFLWRYDTFNNSLEKKYGDWGHIWVVNTGSLADTVNCNVIVTDEQEYTNSFMLFKDGKPYNGTFANNSLIVCYPDWNKTEYSDIIMADCTPLHILNIDIVGDDLTLTYNKDIFQTNETIYLSSKLERNNTPVRGATINYYIVTDE